jgi:hypothetical protein
MKDCCAKMYLHIKECEFGYKGDDNIVFTDVVINSLREKGYVDGKILDKVLDRVAWLEREYFKAGFLRKELQDKNNALVSSLKQLAGDV